MRMRLTFDPQYEISSCGKVYYNGKLLKAKENNSGYLRVKIGNKRYFVHRLVAMTFIPNINKLPIVMHLDNNKHNNNIENLLWGTHSDNTSQAFHEGRLPSVYKPGIGNGLYGDNHPRTKISEEQRLKIYGLYKTGKYTKTQLGKMFNVTRVAISRYV